ncbi:ccnyl1-b, partial [Symbiodinium sp. CCMP2592]
ELETRNWGSGLYQNDVLWRRLGRHLVKQKRIISVLSPFRQDVAQKLADSITAFNDYLNSGNPLRLEQLLQAVDDAPQLLYYRHCSDLELRSHFLLALGGAIRAAEGSAASNAATRLRILAGRVAGTFFSVGGTNVLQPWLDARLTGYCRLWQAATESITQRFKEELRDRLASTITRYASLAGKDAGVASTTASLKLSGWPMAGCPLAHEFSVFVAEKSPHGALGRWSSLDYQAHTMQPEVLMHVCLSVGELDVDTTDAPLARISVSPGLLAKQMQTMTVEDPPPAQPADSPLELAASSDERLAATPPTPLEEMRTVGVSVPTSTSQRTVLSFGGSSKPKGSIITTGMLNADGGDSVPQALGFEAATRSRGNGLRVAQEASKESRDAPKLVRRSIDWGDVSFLQRLVRRGLKAADAGWKQSWEELCEEKQISPSFFVQKPSREVLVEFVEANLCQTTGKAWAQALLYKKEGEDDPAPTDELSDQDSDPPAVLQSDDIQVSASESSFTPQPSQSAPSTVRLQDLGEGVSKPKVGSDGSEQESPQRVEDAAQPPQPPQSEADEAFPDAPMASKVEPEERVAEEADAALSEVPPELAPGKAGKKEKKEKKDKKEKKKDKRAKKEKKEKSDPTTEAQPRESKRQAPQVAIVAAQLDSSSDSSSAEIGHLDILAGGKTCLVDASRAMLCQIPHSSHVKSSFTDAVNGSTGFHDLETIGRLSETEVLDFLESLRVYPGHKLRLLRAIECLRHAVLGADRREEQMLEDDAALQRLCSQNSELTRGKVEAENESKKWQQETRRLLEVIRDQGAELQKQRDKVLELEELVQAQTEQVDFLTSQLHALAQAAGPETLNDMFQSHKGRGVDWGLRDTESPQPDLPVRARAFSDSDSLTMPTPLGGYLHEPAVEPPRAKFAKSMEIPSANAEVDNLIRCLATALQNKVILSVGKPRPHTGSVECLAACAIFLEPVCKDMLEKQVRPREACGEGFPGNEQSDFGTPLSSMCSPLMSKESSAQVSESLNKPSHPFNSIAVRRIPNKWDIYDFLELVIHALEVHPEVSVVTLVYLDRFCETSGIALTPDNWQRLTITAMMLASKVWYDESYENVDFAQKFDLYSLAEINTFERIFLKCVSYDMSVKAVQYAQTYFFLRTLGAKDSVEFTLQPLDEVGESPVKPAWAWGLVHRKLRWVFITSWMAHPAIMTVPFMTPEMIHGPSHYHPMAMIVDPAMVMPKFKEKHEKKSKKDHREKEARQRSFATELGNAGDKATAALKNMLCQCPGEAAAKAKRESHVDICEEPVAQELKSRLEGADVANLSYSVYSNTLWDGSLLLASFLRSQPWRVRGQRVLEIGAGLGLPSIVAAAIGGHVIATEQSPVDLLRREVCRNKEVIAAGGGSIDVQELDWAESPEHISQRLGSFDVVLGCDILAGVKPGTARSSRMLSVSCAEICHCFASRGISAKFWTLFRALAQFHPRLLFQNGYGSTPFRLELHTELIPDPR